MATGDPVQLEPCSGRLIWSSSLMLNCFRVLPFRHTVRFQDPVQKELVDLLGKPFLREEEVQKVVDILRSHTRFVEEETDIPAVDEDFMVFAYGRKGATAARTKRKVERLQEMHGTGQGVTFCATDYIVGSLATDACGRPTSLARHKEALDYGCREMDELYVIEGMAVEFTQNRNPGKEGGFTRGRLGIVDSTPSPDATEIYVRKAPRGFVGFKSEAERQKGVKNHSSSQKGSLIPPDPSYAFYEDQTIPPSLHAAGCDCAICKKDRQQLNELFVNRSAEMSELHDRADSWWDTNCDLWAAERAARGADATDGDVFRDSDFEPESDIALTPVSDGVMGSGWEGEDPREYKHEEGMADQRFRDGNGAGEGEDAGSDGAPAQREDTQEGREGTMGDTSDENSDKQSARGNASGAQAGSCEQNQTSRSKKGGEGPVAGLHVKSTANFVFDEERGGWVFKQTGRAPETKYERDQLLDELEMEREAAYHEEEVEEDLEDEEFFADDSEEEKEAWKEYRGEMPDVQRLATPYRRRAAEFFHQ
uniref:Uncharacterized protein n=1 Tax=Chromera velia CCMP2878 TaxID=1169474 RepID=A0A0G4IEG8_9ALVE|eukprot:Cvel_13674.t1-p1 / transcript=Cvel_13674.t1 / gene=Cvel_13674 / organism=Chromera_velia_CCMP2878 / gene_product=hypothetical protein / transcript_product=hypothetical protein / location=Cvel_scaffold944:27799-30425(+) / protein_length=535 / sequence_SO=supercontig / SO=protein_coding / is_pseudo=false